jgi:AhpD family alkylhydroperoxidase
MTQRLAYATIAHEGMKAFRGVHDYVGHSGLPKELIDLVYLRVSLINGCAYCIDLHTRDLLKSGMKVEKLALVPVWHEAGALFSEKEKAALEWAETVTLVADTKVPDAAYEKVSAQFGEKELADLTIAIALMNAYNRLAISFRKEPTSVKSAPG